ncbi:MAG: AMP-binding protein, partial [Rhodothermia bacterium]|nr:AMP-binding protein [Rhodothermia bacterium]
MKPLSNSQTLLWAGQMIFPDQPLYNMILAFHIEGAIDPERFGRAFQSVVSRSDALRLTFHDSSGVPGCRVVEHCDGLHEFVDLSHDPDPDEALRRHIESRAKRVFDLTEPPTDSCLIKTAPSRFIWYLNQHHLITDGWSSALLFRLTSEAYENWASAKSEDALPSYESYVEYQETFRQSRRAERARQYWNGKLNSVPDRVRFYGRKPFDTTRTRRQTIRLGADRTRRLHALSQQPGVSALTPDISLFNLLTTALFAFLHRVSGQNDLVIGAPAHCRIAPAQKQTVGVFIEVLPLPVQVDNGDTFRSLLDKVAQESSHHMRFALSGSSSAQLSRSFNVLLNYINVSFSSFAGYNVRSEWVHSGFGDSNHHLRVQIHDFDASGSLVLHFDFNEEIFDEALQHQALSDAIDSIDDLLEDLDSPVGKTDALAENKDPGKRPTDEQSRSQTGKDNEDNIVSLFDAQARATPGSVAVSMPGRSFSYKEVLDWSFQLCDQLKARGVGSGDRVGVLMARRVELIPALLGILRSGAAYVPVDPSDPQSRVQFILDDAEVSAIISEDAVLRYLPEALRAKTIAIESVPSAACSNACESNIHTDDPAYLIYTSGSTGEPKGVVVPHGALGAYLSWAVGEYSAARPVDFPLFTSISFDMSVTSLFVPLLCGGRVRVYPETDELDARVLDVVQDDAVDCIK